MTLSLDPHPTFSGRSGPVLIVVADGVGIAADTASNAVTQAETPTLDALLASRLSTRLAAHGTAVGMPTDDDMGNSEVGHNAIGAGRIFAQGAKLVNKALETKTIYASEVWKETIRWGCTGTMHFIGLLSDGNVHSHIEHLHQMINQAVIEGVMMRVPGAYATAVRKKDGEIEIMVHRRIQVDDSRGVQEPLNETMCGCNGHKR